jgi:hypothetical protein
MTTLAVFADELAKLADDIGSKRFRGTERYLIDVDELRVVLRDMVQRMRRVASVKPNARPTACYGRPVSGKRLVTVERK